MIASTILGPCAGAYIHVVLHICIHIFNDVHTQNMRKRNSLKAGTGSRKSPPKFKKDITQMMGYNVVADVRSTSRL